jgi:hypothetical protein
LKELKPVLNPDSGLDIFCHFHTKRVTSTENYAVLNIDANCGVSSSFFDRDKPEVTAAEAELAQAMPFVEGAIFSLASPNQVKVYYTVDFSGVLPDGWEMRAERLTDGRPISFGVAMFHPDHIDEVEGVHRITNTDFRGAEESQCVSIMKETHMFPAGVRCEREAVHLGNHQAISNDYIYEWDFLNRPSSGDPHGLYGFKVTCPHCGLVGGGSATGEQVCSTCSYWNSQLRAGGGFVIDGTHYRPGSGGFGGHIWHVQRNDGTKWSGELFMQGEIPTWFREKFPDNAVFFKP